MLESILQSEPLEAMSWENLSWKFRQSKSKQKRFVDAFAGRNLEKLYRW